MVHIYRLAFSVITLIIIVSCTACSISKETKQLQIVPVDKEFTTVLSEVYEGEEFGVYVVEIDGPSTPLSDLNIIFNGETYYVNYSNPDTYPVCILTAPQVDKDTQMYITANKEGYETVQHEITILNRKQLQISPSHISVESGGQINIMVTDEENMPLLGVKVTFKIQGGQSYDATTDQHGKVSFSAPSVEKDTTFFITASKESYESASIQGVVKAVSSGLLPSLPVLPIVGLTVFVIFIFAGVVKRLHREEDTIDEIERGYNRFKPFHPPGSSQIKNHSAISTSQIPHGEARTQEKTPKTQPQTPQVPSIGEHSGGKRKAVRIEEIVIGKPETLLPSAKKVTQKKTEEPVRIAKLTRKATPDAWVIGEDSVRAKIDRKIGGSESSKRDVTRWLTGTEDIAAKVDEKLRQYEKKKKNEDSSQS
ncbi:MAG TPA: carboxypeptidase regulatory-like domain-containing protein [Thermoplasmatales archaeon]|nr:carboxypeptidase regulatory-like domain-containing protein [Thermoplasmatales archaeon]